MTDRYSLRMTGRIPSGESPIPESSQFPRPPFRDLGDQKDDFPTTLRNPANNAGFALSHRLYGYWMIYQTGHFTCLENRTFLLANDSRQLDSYFLVNNRRDCHSRYNEHIYDL